MSYGGGYHGGGNGSDGGNGGANNWYYQGDPYAAGYDGNYPALEPSALGPGGVTGFSSSVPGPPQQPYTYHQAPIDPLQSGMSAMTLSSGLSPTGFAPNQRGGAAAYGTAMQPAGIPPAPAHMQGTLLSTSSTGWMAPQQQTSRTRLPAARPLQPYPLQQPLPGYAGLYPVPQGTTDAVPSTGRYAHSSGSVGEQRTPRSRKKKQESQQCPINGCEAQILGAGNMGRHVKCHKEGIMKFCRCGASFATLVELWRHRGQQICKHGISKEDAEKEMQKLPNYVAKKLKCPYPGCEKAYADWSSVQRHHLNIHRKKLKLLAPQSSAASGSSPTAYATIPASPRAVPARPGSRSGSGSGRSSAGNGGATGTTRSPSADVGWLGGSGRERSPAADDGWGNLSASMFPGLRDPWKMP